MPRNIVFGRGIHLAVEAFARVARERPRVTGDCFEPRYAERVRALVRERGVSGRVLFTGSVARPAMLELYRSAALTLIPSLCYEGTSLAALESMSAGTPVVGTTLGGLNDLPCVHAEPEAHSLARAALEALERRPELAAAQRLAVGERFDRKLWQAAWLRAIAA